MHNVKLYNVKVLFADGDIVNENCVSTSSKRAEDKVCIRYGEYTIVKAEATVISEVDGYKVTLEKR